MDNSNGGRAVIARRLSGWRSAAAGRAAAGAAEAGGGEAKAGGGRTVPVHSVSMLRKGDRVEVEVERLAFGGQGIARSDGMVVFVRGAVPGDRVAAVVTRRRPRFADARLLELLAPSPLRRDAACAHDDECGGCEWQALEYAAQLRFKQDQVVESLEHIAGLHAGPDGFAVEPILGMDEPWGYRNKMEFSFGEDEQGRLLLGLHRRGSWREIVELDGCRLAATCCSIWSPPGASRRRPSCRGASSPRPAPPASGSP